MVFDLFNVLTSSADAQQNDLGAAGGNHHRLRNDIEQHQVENGNSLLVYPRKPGDNHPSPAGLQKATQEFIELFRYRYRLWKG